MGLGFLNKALILLFSPVDHPIIFFLFTLAKIVLLCIEQLNILQSIEKDIIRSLVSLVHVLWHVLLVMQMEHLNQEKKLVLKLSAIPFIPISLSSVTIIFFKRYIALKDSRDEHVNAKSTC